MEVLLKTPKAYEVVSSAVAENNDSELKNALLEALRINYIIPILWRRVAEDTLLGKGTRKLKAARKGTILAISNQAAMLDGKRIHHPKHFDQNRSPDVNMAYGHNFHYCVGDQISNTILIEIFKALMACAPKRSSTKPKTNWMGMYPWNLYLDYTKMASSGE